MTVRQDLTTALNGGTPEHTPLSIYDAFPLWSKEVDDWWPLIREQGLGLCAQVHTVQRIEHGVKETTEDKTEGGDIYRISRKETPVGNLQYVMKNWYPLEHWIKTPRDYQIQQWIVEHTELRADYDIFHKREAELGDQGVTVDVGSRTPAMSINIEWAGTEQFCFDIAIELDEMMSLYEAEKKLFMEETRLIAAGPSRFTKWGENLTVSMLGPKRYTDLLVSIYNEAAPILEVAGKRVMVHYDGALRAVADEIAKAPFHIIESLTEPPEGDLTYDECRALWPDKAFWGNINVGIHHLSKEEIREQIIAKRQRAGKRGFAFNISENYPHNWRETVPAILEALRELD